MRWPEYRDYLPVGPATLEDLKKARRAYESAIAKASRALDNPPSCIRERPCMRRTGNPAPALSVRQLKTPLMPVYVDKAENRFGRMVMCHMIADTLVELHEMADLIGLRRDWFQPASSPHYDLSKSRRADAIRFGAIELDRHAFVATLKRLRAERLAAL